MTRVPEIAVSRWWHRASLTEPLATEDGRPISIVFRGVWSHGFGPDFRDAMVDFGNGVLAAGSVEIHLRSSDWERHGHHLDPTYDEVVLHACLEIDTGETRTSSGKIVPRMVLPVRLDELRETPQDAFDWSLVGGEVCAESIASEHPSVIKHELQVLGDRRMSAKTARIEARFVAASPAQVLYEELFDGLGYMANRAPMRALAEMVPLSSIEATLATEAKQDRSTATSALLLGTGGFLPLALYHSEMLQLNHDETTAIESYWSNRGSPWHSSTILPTAWKLARVRPTNHPLLRLQAGALIVAHSSSGLLQVVLEAVRSNGSIVDTLLQLTQWKSSSLLGTGRAVGLVINAILPVAFAFASTTRDAALEEGASMTWDRLARAEPNAITRRAMRQVCGAASLRAIGARAQQGLIHLDTTYCAPRRCYECPIAGIVLESSIECDTPPR